jgi:2-keto-3-deoxy-6-phosphogluconate aldolase
VPAEPPAGLVDNAQEAFRASEAAIAGGVKALEITLSTPGALRVIERLVEEHGSNVSIGAGTVLDGHSAYASIAAGASFLVSPHFEPRDDSNSESLSSTHGERGILPHRDS